MTPAHLVELADKIDRRLGPISGREADHLAVALRWAASLLLGIPHPTGSEAFSAALARLGVPAPWELHDEELGVILAANKQGVATVEASRPYQEIETEIALEIITAVNTCAGFKAYLTKGINK